MIRHTSIGLALLLIAPVTNAQEEVDSTAEFYKLEYPAYERTIRIEKPKSTTPTDASVAPSVDPAIEVVSRDLSLSLDEYHLAETIRADDEFDSLSADIAIYVADSVCEAGPRETYASFTVCNEEDTQISVLRDISIPFATLLVDESDLVVESNACGRISLSSKPDPIAFDCSGIFSLKIGAKRSSDDNASYIVLTAGRHDLSIEEAR